MTRHVRDLSRKFDAATLPSLRERCRRAVNIPITSDYGACVSKDLTSSNLMLHKRSSLMFWNLPTGMNFFMVRKKFFALLTNARAQKYTLVLLQVYILLRTDC